MCNKQVSGEKRTGVAKFQALKKCKLMHFFAYSSGGAPLSSSQ